MTTLAIRTLVRNAAAVFSGAYGAVTRRAKQAGCSRQTLYDHARTLERQLETEAGSEDEVENVVGPTTDPSDPTPTLVLDESTRRRFAVSAFAMGIRTRQIEDLLRILAPDDGPDHAAIARWAAQQAKTAAVVLEVLDAARAAEVQTPALDEVFLGGGRPRSPSSRQA